MPNADDNQATDVPTTYHYRYDGTQTLTFPDLTPFGIMELSPPSGDVERVVIDVPVVIVHPDLVPIDDVTQAAVDAIVEPQAAVIEQLTVDDTPVITEPSTSTVVDTDKEQ